MNFKITTRHYILVAMFLIVCSCRTHWRAEITIITNNSKETILVAIQPDEIMTDSIVYNEIFSKRIIEAKTTERISLPNIILSTEPDSSKAYLYVFKLDSIQKYQELGQVDGVLKSSLLKKMQIQLNRVKEPLDTIYLNSI